MVEVAKLIADSISSRWSATPKPRIGIVYDFKTIRVESGDWILTYESGGSDTAQTLGATSWLYTATVTVDLRSADRTRYLLEKAELLRILRSLAAEPLHADQSGYGIVFLALLTAQHELSNRLRRMYRATFDLRVYRWAEVERT